jgi:hypothetical protein
VPEAGTSLGAQPAQFVISTGGGHYALLQRGKTVYQPLRISGFSDTSSTG